MSTSLQKPMRNDTYHGEDRRDPRNRWSRALEHRMDKVEMELEDIRGQLNEGKHTMNTLKIGQELVLSELSKNTAATQDVKTSTDGLVNLYTNLLGFHAVARWLAILIIATAALIGAIAVILTLLKTGNLPEPKHPAPAVVAPATGVSR